MSLLAKIRDFLKGLDERDMYVYIGMFCLLLTFLLGLLIYINYSRVNRHLSNLQQLNIQRGQTKKILANYKAVSQQQARVEEILAENKNFRIGEAFGNIITRLGLAPHQSEIPTPTATETVSGKTEVILTTRLNSISMKQLTDLLNEIANIIQMYPKDLVIKKVPNSQAVDIDLTIATLEPEASE